MSKVYGYAVVDSEGNLAPTNRKVYDSQNAAANGFYQWTKRMWYGEYDHLKGKKLREQDVFKVIGLVAEPTPEILKLVFADE